MNRNVPAARAVAELVGVSYHFAGIQLETVPSWRQATERMGTDGKSLVLPINFAPCKVGGMRRGVREGTARRAFCPDAFTQAGSHADWSAVIRKR